MKKIVLLILSVFMTFSVCSAAFETSFLDTISGYFDKNPAEKNLSDSIKVQLDGEYLDFTDSNGDTVEPQLINNRTMVPLRKIFESLGCEISWEQETQTVTAKSENKEIKLVINDNTAKVKDLNSSEESIISLDSAPVIVEQRTLVPVRFIAESLEKEVNWDQDNKAVVIIDYDNLTKKFEEYVPTLQYLFDLDLEEVKSYKSTSTLTGTIQYKDADDKKNNEKIAIKGTINYAINGNDMELDLKATLTGTQDSILEAIKEQGYDKIDYKIILKDGVLYQGKLNGKKYEWTEMNTENVQFTSIFGNSKLKVKSYEDIINIAKSLNEKVDIDTYNHYIQSFKLIGMIFSNEGTKVTNSKTKTSVAFDIDFGKVLATVVPKEVIDISSVLKLNVSTKFNFAKRIPTNGITEIDIGFIAQESSENIGATLKLSTKISDVNKELSIKAPNL